MPLNAVASAREILTGLHEVMAKRGSAQAKLGPWTRCEEPTTTSAASTPSPPPARRPPRSPRA
jgi:hypothetical protein